MRLTFTKEEYNSLYMALSKHKETDLQNLLHRKFKESLPSKEGIENKARAGKQSRKLVERKKNLKVDYAIQTLKSQNKDITITSVANEAGIAYNTAKKYKVRIMFAQNDRIRANQQ